MAATRRLQGLAAQLHPTPPHPTYAPSAATDAAPPRPPVEPLQVTLRGDEARGAVFPGTKLVGRTVTIRSLAPTDLVAALAFSRRMLWRDRWHYNQSEATVKQQVENSGRRYTLGGGIHLVLVETRQEEYDGEVISWDEIYGEAMYSWPVTQVRNGVTITDRSLFGMAVDREFQGNGAGRALMGRLLQLAEEHRYGPEVMALGVQDINERAWRLYESMGFVRLPER